MTRQVSAQLWTRPWADEARCTIDSPGTTMRRELGPAQTGTTESRSSPVETLPLEAVLLHSQVGTTQLAVNVTRRQVYASTAREYWVVAVH